MQISSILSVYAVSNENEWTHTTIFSSSIDWFIENADINEDNFIIYNNSDNIYDDGYNTYLTITYKDNKRQLNYPYRLDGASVNPTYPIKAEKINICNIPVAVLTTHEDIFSGVPYVMASEFEGPRDGYNRTFMNLNKEGQAIKIFDDISTKAHGAVPLTIFLKNSQYKCENNFISFPESD